MSRFKIKDYSTFSRAMTNGFEPFHFHSEESTVYIFIYKRSVLRRQSKDTNRNIKRLVYCRYTDIVKSNVSSIDLSSERNRK